MKESKLTSILMYAGSLPFIILAFIIIFKIEIILPRSIWVSLFIGYGAIILSFLGGIHWGFAISQQSTFSNYLLISSNLIALLAWGSLYLHKLWIVLILFLFGYSIQLMIDLRLYRVGLIPASFLKLRKIITCIVLGTFVLVSLSIFTKPLLS